MKIPFLIAAFALALILPARAQYPQIAPDVVAEAKAKQAAADQRSDEAFAKAMPTIKEWEAKGKPYLPGAAKPSDLPQAKVPAFPGAFGGGMYSFGGRGGKVFVVTNLNDNGPGSFREACEAGGPRIVVFNVAGIIRLKDRIRIRAPYITICGNTAPGDGVCIAGNTVELERARRGLDLALSGGRVAVVSGGDAGVFGMASAVFEAAMDERYADVKITVLPAVTAAQAVAARAGAPLGGDYAVVSLSDRLKPWSVIEERLRAVAGADLVLAIYNPASRTRRDQIVRARELLLELRPPETPVVVGRHVGRHGENLTVTTLEALQPDGIDMSCLLIIGSSQTRLGHGSTVWTSRSHDQ